MLTARLPLEIEQKLNVYSDANHTSKSEVVIKALEKFFDHQDAEVDSLTLGKPYFGKYASGDRDRSVTYKQRIKGRPAEFIFTC